MTGNLIIIERERCDKSIDIGFVFHKFTQKVSSPAHHNPNAFPHTFTCRDSNHRVTTCNAIVYH